MKSWRRPIIVLAVATIWPLLIVLLSLPLRSLAAPTTGFAGTPTFLPVVEKNFVQPPTSTITITVGPVIGSEQLVFSPATATIHVGDTVHWVWGSTGHTVTSGSPPGTADHQFCSPNNINCDVPNTSSAGQTFDHEFLAQGTYPFFCKIHYSFGMTGTITVLP